MSKIIRINDQYYILASSSIAEESSRVLKYSDTFAVFDRHGDIRPLGFEDQGLFHEGTRYLSRNLFRIEGRGPLLLSSSIDEDNCFYAINLTNPDFTSNGQMVRKGTLYIRRYIFLRRGVYYEKVRVHNYGESPVEFSFHYEFDADHIDIFEVRGTSRVKRGKSVPPFVDNNRLVFEYSGLDGQQRSTLIEFFESPAHIDESMALFHVSIESGSDAEYSFKIICCRQDRDTYSEKSFDSAFNKTRKEYSIIKEKACAVDTSNEQFNNWINRSKADLFMMLTKKNEGYYPYAGIPWYNTVFGRDGIVTALQTLWFYPEIARGVISYLASTQALALNKAQEAEPGKIIHEQRNGEMANTGEIPFGRYYGTVDATPLFIILVWSYYERTSDINFLRKLWPHLEMALNWIDKYGDIDGDGFVEYRPRSERGLTNMGWKDSGDSIFHADGRLADPPIALCEVQGYVYDAKLKASRIAAVLGHDELSCKLKDEAEHLKDRFQSAFWCEEIGMYAVALDGNKEQCRVRTSNAGHTLFSGIATSGRARTIADILLSDMFFNGWGIRTLGRSEKRYNPMSYHNGSVWPHDNSLIASGMNRYGLKESVLKILTGMFDASLFVDLNRLPELFCGFERSRGEGPVLYPVACDPQAWAAGSVFILLEASLGISINAPEKRIYFNFPALPPFLNEVTIRNLGIGDARISMTAYRHAEDVSINIHQRSGGVDVVVIK